MDDRRWMVGGTVDEIFAHDDNYDFEKTLYSLQHDAALGYISEKLMLEFIVQLVKEIERLQGENIALQDDVKRMLPLHATHTGALMRGCGGEVWDGE